MEKTVHESAPKHEHRQLNKEYRASLDTVHDQHISGMRSVLRDYRQDVQSLLADEDYSAVRFEEVLQRPGLAMGETLQTTHASLEDTLTEFSGRAVDLLGSEDRRVWDAIQNQLSRGTNARWLTACLGEASSKRAQKTLRIAFDRSMWSIMMHKLESGVTSDDFGLMDRLASSSRASRLMREAFDRHVWNAIVKRASESIKLREFDVLLNMASSTKARDAMHCAFDQFVWRSIKSKINSRQIMQRTLRDHLDFVSRDDVHMVMLKVLFEGVSSGRAPEPQGPQQPQWHTAVECLVAATVDRDHSTMWLQSADPKLVLRVMNTVRQLRTDKGLSDRQIYLRYRKAVDKPEGETNEELNESFQVLNALMGGIDGTLPQW